MITTTENRATTGKVMALGLLLAALMAASLLAAGQARASTTFTVNSTEDHSDAVLTVGSCDTGYQVPGPRGALEAECTLRAAIEQANSTAGADTINFAIPGSGVKTISPNPGLPEITEAVSIDGYSQPGARPNQKAVGNDAVLKIVLSGASAPYGSGLRIGASNSTVKGLVVNRWGDTGILVSGSGSTGNRVAGNYIGADAWGTRDLGNGDDGVTIYSAPDNIIGGTTPAERNVISGNGRNGVYIEGADATGNKIMGNYVGTDKNGTAPLGNFSPGILINGPSNNTIGGTLAGAGNVISANGSTSYEGVAIYGDGATGNRILSNSIFANGAIGIDLNADGPTVNDPGDTDTGANGSQNKPVITSANTGGGTTIVRGRLNSAANKTFRVQFFSYPSRTDEGKVFIGQRSVTTDGSGNATFFFSPAQKVGVGRTVTATATSPAGNTSEFSTPRIVASV
jgi:CSLREA domain-containing protein